MSLRESRDGLERGLRRNPALLCVYRGLQMALFPMAVITLFMKHEVGLSMGEIMLLQAIFGLVTAVFEFPSGYLADRIGYRRTLVASSAMAIIASQNRSSSAFVRRRYRLEFHPRPKC